MPTEGTTRIVRARLKPLAQIPAPFLCCEGMRQRFIDTSMEVVDAMPDSLFDGEVECPFCRRILHNVKYVKIRLRSKMYKGACIAVACYEFDEGVLR